MREKFLSCPKCMTPLVREQLGSYYADYCSTCDVRMSIAILGNAKSINKFYRGMEGSYAKHCCAL